MNELAETARIHADQIRLLTTVVNQQQQQIDSLRASLIEAVRVSTEAKFIADSLLDWMHKHGLSVEDADPSPTRRF